MLENAPNKILMEIVAEEVAAAAAVVVTGEGERSATSATDMDTLPESVRKSKTDVTVAMV